MKRLLFTLICSLLCMTTSLCHAQRVMSAEDVIRSSGGRISFFEGIYRETRPQLFSWKLNSPVTLDESRIVVKYDADIRLDSLSTSRAKDQVLTLIGPKMILSHGLWIWRESVSSTAYYSKKDEKPYFDSLLSEIGAKPRGYVEMINWFVYRDLKARTILNKHTLPMRQSSIEYTESLPQMSWSISEETKEILGYDCQKAETDFRGRHWTVWFASEIPVDCGLWKFSGLPGLIMEASSADDFYVFTAVSIENKAIKIQTYPKVETNKLTREKFRAMESAVYANPISGGVFDQQNGQDYIIGSHITAGDPKDTDTKIFTPNTYLGLYFPMELE